LEQESAHGAGKIRFRLRKGTVVGDQTGTVGLNEKSGLNLAECMTIGSFV
jgi:ribosomal protein S5